MELHIIFFILAALLMVILIGYSVWSSRREKLQVFSNLFSQRAEQPPQDESQKNVPPFAQTPEYKATPEASQQLNETQVAQEVERSLNSIKISLQGQEAPPQKAETIYQAPQSKPVVQVAEPAPVKTETVENQTIQLYVVAPQGATFTGEAIVAKLEDLGLHYDTEYQIFQRHIDTPASPTIFGVANMMQPGIFDLNTLHRFSTIGLVFFMNVPSASNDQANFRVMLNNAENLAQSLGGFVLDDQRQLFSDASLLSYLQRL